MKKILLVFASAVLLGGCNRLDAHEPLTTAKLPAPLNSTVAQSFYASRDNLNIVAICLRNPDRLLAPMTFTLHEATSSSPAVRTIEFSGGNIDNSDCTKFQFDPVSDSAGKTYLAQISLGGLPALSPPYSYPPYLEVDLDSGYPDGHGFQNDTLTGYDFHFKTYFRQDLDQVVKESLTQLPPRLLSDPGFLVFYLVLLGFIVYLLLKNSR